MIRREHAPLAALAAILVITAAWWALALWPLPADTPAWLEQARLACFGSRRDTLPSPAGWLLLIGEPVALTAMLVIVWPRTRRHAIALMAPAAVVAVAAVTMRVGSLQGEPFDPVASDPAPVRLDREAPPLALTDQHGRRVTLEDFRGRTVLVVFAFAHCATVCPVIVHDAVEATRAVAGSVLLIVTLDPWRDTPARLPAIAQRWALGPSAHVLSGAPAEVEQVIDAWEYPRRRDPSTGDLTHATFVYIVDRAGRLAWQAPGREAAMRALLDSP